VAPSAVLDYSPERSHKPDAGTVLDGGPEELENGDNLEPTKNEPEANPSEPGASAADPIDPAEPEASEEMVIEEEDISASGDAQPKKRKPRGKKGKRTPKEKPKPTADSPATDRAISDW
jgi:hypothetical protein